MKRQLSLIIFCAALFFLASCNAKKNNPNLLNAADLVNNPIEANGKISGDTSLFPKIHFYETEFDFGDKIIDGEVVTHNFKFKNTGKSPLIISKAEASCGCTASEFSREPIAPNAEGNIKVTYNSNGRPGDFQKSIIVVSNTIPNETKLLIIGDVKEAK